MLNNFKIKEEIAFKCLPNKNLARFVISYGYIHKLPFLIPYANKK